MPLSAFPRTCFILGAKRRSRPSPGRPSVLAAFQLSRAVRGVAFASHSCSAKAASVPEDTTVLFHPASWASASSAKVAPGFGFSRRSAAPRNQKLPFPSPVPHTQPLGNPASWHCIAPASLAACPQAPQSPRSVAISVLRPGHRACLHTGPSRRSLCHSSTHNSLLPVPIVHVAKGPIAIERSRPLCVWRN